MAVIRNREVGKPSKEVTRRRDRVRDEADDDEVEPLEDIDATPRQPVKKATRRPAPVEDEDSDQMVGEEDEEEPEPPRKATKKAAPRTRTALVDDEYEDDDEDEAPPRKAPAATKVPRGVYPGLAGADEVRRSANGGGATRLALSNEPELIKVLEPEPLCSYRQHWVGVGQGQGDRPYTCPGVDCPLCGLGDSTTATHVFNVLHLSAPTQPVNKVMQIGIRAYNSFKDQATGRDGKIRFQKEYWSVQRSGSGQSSQTNFKPVKLEDIHDDWPELLDNFDLEELPQLIEEAKEKVFDLSIIQVVSDKALKEVAKIMANEDGVTIFSATAWKTNAEMIEDVATLGYLGGRVLDCTYGMGTWWKWWQPEDFVTSDLDPDMKADHCWRFTDMPVEDDSFDSVVMDPPYKLNGTPSKPDVRYGVHVPTDWRDRHILIRFGITECARVTRKYLLLKCQDQVCRNQKRWQTIEFTNHAATAGLVLVDRFDILRKARSQPSGRRQVHTHSNHSTLLVFEKQP